MLIMKKVRLVSPPPPAFVGTRLVIRVTEDHPKFGLSSVEVAEGRESVTLSWGDGTVEKLTAISEKEHAYAEPGVYEVCLSDDASAFKLSATATGTPYSDEYPAMVERLYSNAQALKLLRTRCFWRSTGMTDVDLQDSAIESLQTQTFSSCTAMRTCRLPRVLDSMNSRSFWNCEKLEAIELPTGVYELPSGCFEGCVALSGEIMLPSVEKIMGSIGVFTGCTRISGIHFAAANEATVKASAAYQADPTLGTGVANVCKFDL